MTSNFETLPPAPILRKKYIIWWKQSSARKKGSTNSRNDYYKNNSPECCNTCFRAIQYDRINENKFSSGYSLVDTIRVKAKLIFECAECRIFGGLSNSPVVDVTLLHLRDDALPSPKHHIVSNNCIADNKGFPKIDYREQNTLIDPKLCEHCITCPDHPNANINLLLQEEGGTGI
jgi:hypothetical protein